MIKMIKNENYLKDTLYCLHPSAGCSSQEQKGILRASISFYMAFMDCKFETAVNYIIQLIPRSCNLDNIMFDCWKDEFNKNKHLQGKLIKYQ
jgi:hypothetical protein